MDHAVPIVIAVALSVAAMFYVVTGSFVPLKGNTVFMQETNNQTMATLQAELTDSAGTDVTASGSSIKSLINSSVSNANIEIYVDGTKWDGKTYADSNISISESDKYTRTIEVTEGKTIYKFTKK